MPADVSVPSAGIEQLRVQRAKSSASVRELRVTPTHTPEEVSSLKAVEKAINSSLAKRGMRCAVRFAINTRGLVITVVTNALIFPGNSANLLAEGQTILGVVAAPLAKQTRNIEVDGFTNQEKVSTAPFISGWSCRRPARRRWCVPSSVTGSRVSPVRGRLLRPAPALPGDRSARGDAEPSGRDRRAIQLAGRRGHRPAVRRVPLTRTRPDRRPTHHDRHCRQGRQESQPRRGTRTTTATTRAKKPSLFKSKKFIIGVVALLGIGYEAYSMFFVTAPVVPPAAGVNVPLDATTVNLSSGHFLKIGVTVVLVAGKAALADFESRRGRSNSSSPSSATGRLRRCRPRRPSTSRWGTSRRSWRRTIRTPRVARPT